MRKDPPLYSCQRSGDCGDTIPWSTGGLSPRHPSTPRRVLCRLEDLLRLRPSPWADEQAPPPPLVLDIGTGASIEITARDRIEITSRIASTTCHPPPLHLGFIAVTHLASASGAVSSRLHLSYASAAPPGASAIYPLLGSALLGWRFIASEIDEATHAHARAHTRTSRPLSRPPSRPRAFGMQSIPLASRPSALPRLIWLASLPLGGGGGGARKRDSLAALRGRLLEI